VACAAGAWAGVAAAVVLGANPLITAITVAIALASYLSGLYAVAAAAIAIGIVGDVAVAHGLARAIAELVVGAGLLAAGLTGLYRAHEA